MKEGKKVVSLFKETLKNSSRHFRTRNAILGIFSDEEEEPSSFELAMYIHKV
jgi:hypothetical protein